MIRRLGSRQPADPGRVGGTVAPVADGARRRDSILAIRLLASGFVVLLGVSSLLGLDLSVTWYRVLAEATQGLLATVGAVAVIFGRWRIALGAAALVAVLAVGRGGASTGSEVIFLFVAAVGVAATAARRYVVAFLAAGPVGVWAFSRFDANSTDAGVAPIFFVGGIVIGLAARWVLRAQRDSARRLAAEAELTREARAAVRRELATDLGALVAALLADSRRILGGVDQFASARELRSALAAVAEDARAAMGRLRALLAVLDESAEWPPPEPDPRGRRRAGGARWRRWVWLASTALIAAAFVVGDGRDPAYNIAGSLGVLAFGVAPLSRRLAAALALVTVGMSLLTQVPTLTGPLSIGLLVALAARARGRTASALAVVALVAFVGWGNPAYRSGWSDPVAREEALVVLAIVALAILDGLIAGLWLGRHDRLMEAERAEAAVLARERAEAAVQERAATARELHDLVGHELSLVSLRTLAVEGERDPIVLRAAMADIAETVEALQESLDTLLDQLSATMGRLEEAGPLVAPSDAVASVSDTLRGHGQVVKTRVDPGVDSVSATLQRTLERILRETATNMMRHAPAGGLCEVDLTCESGAVVLMATNPLGQGRLDLSTGAGLRGIEERVRWHGGSMMSGPRGDGTWVLRVSLPLGSGLPELAGEGDVAFPVDVTRATRAERAGG